MSKKYVCTVIILNYNGKEFLKECLEGLENQSFKDFKITIVDNGSSDSSIEYIEEYKKKSNMTINLIKNDKNYGFAKGNNQAIKLANTEFIVLLNNDAIPEKDWLKNLVSSMYEHPECGLISSKIVYYRNRDKIDSAGDLFTKWGLAKTRGRGESIESYNKIEYIFGACACAAIYRKEIFDKVGLFDEDFFAYNEDVDLSFRAQLMGYKCLYLPTAIVYHYGSETSKKFPNFRLYLSRRNVVYTYLKNMPGYLFKKYLFKFILYVIAGDLKLIIKGGLIPVIKSRIVLIKDLLKLRKKRKYIQNNKVKVSPEYIESLFT